MTDAALDARAVPGAKPVRPSLDKGFDPRTAIVFLLLLGGGLLFVAYSLYADVAASGAKTTTFLPYLLLFVALLIALGFEFVNGFHDTANAVATVIYTHSMPAQIAVVWSGSFNFLGVLLSSGAVAFGIISLLPVELILQVGSSAGFAMVFALLIAAIIWNLGTWYLGLPASRPGRHLRCRLGSGCGDRQGTPNLSAGWLLCRGALAAPDEISDTAARIVPCARDGQAARMVDPRPSDLYLHGCQLCPWLQ